MTMQELCRLHTSLSEEDIAQLQTIAQGLPSFSLLMGVDLFIDCLVRDGQRAVVVAEQKPSLKRSILSKTVLGQIVDKTSEPGVLRTLQTGVVTEDLKAVTVENVPMMQRVAPITNAKQQVIGVLVSETEDLEAASHLQALKSQSLSLVKTVDELSGNLWIIAQHINDAILIFNSAQKVSHYNMEASELYQTLGYMQELMGMDLQNLVLDGQMYEDLIHCQKNIDKEIAYSSLSLQVHCVFLHQAADIHMAMIIRDMTAIREKDRQLVLKSVAVQEMHHRVKNNLQAISSVLHMQARRAQSEEISTLLYENMNRVLSVATIHDLLVQNDLATLNLATLLEKIRDNTLGYATPSNKRITMAVCGDALLVPSDTATTIGLIVNELLSNAMKHAFVGLQEGKVEIRIEKNTPLARITVADNGVGYDADAVGANTLGVHIINMLVKEKLKGTVETFRRPEGMETSFTFAIE